MPSLVLLVLWGVIGPSMVLSLPSVLGKVSRIKRLWGSLEHAPTGPAFHPVPMRPPPR